MPTENPLEPELSALPIHTVRHARAALRVEGLVERPLDLDQGALAGLPRTTLDQPFACEEGWSVPGLLPFALPEASTALPCDRLDEQPRPVEHGAPWRLRQPN